jgi:hypothetical protein
MKSLLEQRVKRWYMWSAITLVFLLVLFRAIEYIALWQSGRAALGQIGTDLVGVFWLLGILTTAAVIVAVTKRFASKFWNLLTQASRSSRSSKTHS